MLAQAPVYPYILYFQAPAEELPFADSSFDLITVSLAFHWFDRSRFLAEAHRLLRPTAWLVIYNNGFSGIMKENPKFEQWYKNSYLTRYPTPSRNNQPLTNNDALEHGFNLVRCENYSNDVAFTIEQLASYLTTQSNVIATVEQGTENIESVYSWLISSLSSLFASTVSNFSFGGSIWYLQNI